MAWIQIDTDLEAKPEYVKLLGLTKASRAELTRRIFQLWCWIDTATEDGLFAGLDESDLANQFEGTTPEFWKCFEDSAVQWLAFTPKGVEVPGYEKRFSQSAKKRANDARRAAHKRSSQGDEEGASHEKRQTSQSMRRNCDLEQRNRTEQKSKTDISVQSSVGTVDGNVSGGKTWSQACHDVTLDQVAEVAEELFRQANYTGDDGGIFWQAAAVLEAVPEGLNRAMLVEAAVNSQKSRKPAPAYFRGAMRKMCPDFDERIKQVWIEPQWPKRSPVRLSREAMGGFQLRRPPEKPPDDPSLDRVIAQIEALK